MTDMPVYEQTVLFEVADDDAQVDPEAGDDEADDRYEGSDGYTVIESLHGSEAQTWKPE